MSKDIFLGINNKAAAVSQMFIGKNGVAHPITQGFIGINGVAKQFWPNYDFTAVLHQNENYPYTVTCNNESFTSDFEFSKNSILTINSTHPKYVYDDVKIFTEPWIKFYVNYYSSLRFDLAYRAVCYAVEGMTWEQYISSIYNTSTYSYGRTLYLDDAVQFCVDYFGLKNNEPYYFNQIYRKLNETDWGIDWDTQVTLTEEIIDGYTYYSQFKDYDPT